MPVAPKKAAGAKKTARSKPKTVKIAIMGSGELSEKAFKALVTDHLTQFSKDNVSFVLAMRKGESTDTLTMVGDFLTANEYDYEFVTDDGGPRVRAFKPYVQNATEVFEVKRGYVQKIVRLLASADVGQLFALLDEGDEELDKTMMEAFSKGVKVYNLIDGLDELEPADEDESGEDEEEDDETEEDSDEEEESDDDEADDEEEDEEPAPKAKKRAPKRTVAEEDDEDDEEETSEIDVEALADTVAEILAKRLVNA